MNIYFFIHTTSQFKMFSQVIGNRDGELLFQNGAYYSGVRTNWGAL